MAKLAKLKFDNKSGTKGRWKAFYGDVMLCQSVDKFRVVGLIKNGECAKAVELGVIDVEGIEDISAARSSLNPMDKVIPHNVPVLNKPQFSVNERFEYLADFTDMVIKGNSHALLIVGGSGVGKSHTVVERFQLANLISSDVNQVQPQTEDTGEDVSVKDYGDFVVIKGFSTAKFMYRTLWNNRKKIILYDDTDKVLEDKTAIGILKAALDSHDRRFITWGAEQRMGISDDLPSRFEFEGGIIFISNKPLEHFDQTIKSRCFYVDINMTPEEMLERIEDTLPDLEKNMAMREKQEILKFLRENVSIATDLNFRTFLKVCWLKKSFPNKWRKQALYTITA